MKRLLLTISVLMFGAAVTTSFRPEQPQSISPAAEVKAQFLDDLRAFQLACQHLQESTQSLTEATLPQAQ
ncbi:MAG: hypothetical protein AAF992_07870 [Bacteroidota bacterium]